MCHRLARIAFILTLAAVCVGLPSTSYAEKFAGEFMAMGGGARAMGMGSAFVGVADDASTLYWNPAGISGFEKRQALFMHSERFGDMVNYNFGAFVSPTSSLVSEEREASFGLALIHLGVDDIIITNHLPYEERNGVPGFQEGDKLLYGDASTLPREGNNDFALFGSFALNTSVGRVGGTLKIIYTDAIAGYTSTGIGLDLGYVRRELFSRFDVGVKLQDITGTYISWSSGTNEFIAPSVKLGAAYRIDAPKLNAAVLLAADSDIFFEDRRRASQFWVETFSTDLHLGIELQFQEKVMVRGGLDAGNPTAGAGFRIGPIGLDYAYLHHDDFEATHRISGQVEF
jgi:hypothetical protein